MTFSPARSTTLANISATVRFWAATALGEIGDAQATEPLVAALRDQDAVTRSAAAAALGSIGNVQAAAPLVAMLRDKSEQVRKSAGKALADIGWQPRDDCERALLAVALGEWDKASDVGRAAIGPLAAPLEDQDVATVGVRRHAAMALGRIGDAQAVGPLAAALRDPSAGVRRSAAEALGQIGDVHAAEPLLTSLRDPIQFVMQAVLHALEQIGWEPTDEGQRAALGAARDRVRDEEFLSAAPLSRVRRHLLWLDPQVLDLTVNADTWIQERDQIIRLQCTEKDVHWAKQVNEYAVKAVKAGEASNYKEAINLYKAALGLAPGCDLYLMSIGCCYANLGDFARGLKYLERANEISPDQERITNNLQGVRQAATRAK